MGCLGCGKGPPDERNAGGNADEGGTRSTHPQRADVRCNGAAAVVDEALIELGDERFVRRCITGPCRTEGDGGTQDLGVLGIGVVGVRPPTGSEGVKELCHAAGGHDSISSPTLAAMRRARCWSTFALLTVISMV